MDQAEREPRARAASGDAQSPSRSSGERRDRDSIEPHADPNLDATLESFSDLGYRDLFWPRRRYEDLSDRLALRALLPSAGERLIEVGAGYGRLADEYGGYREVVLLDASDALLKAARERLVGSPRFTIVAGDAFQLPYPDSSFDAAVCVRVLHHFEDPRPAIRELARVLRPGGVLVVEFANKRNLKGMLARLMGRQGWSPFSRGSRRYEDLSLLPPRRPSSHARSSAWQTLVPTQPARWTSSTSFLHAPVDMRSWLRSSGFAIEATRSVGLFRLLYLTTHLPLGVLAGLEKIQQSVLAQVTPGPSVFIKAARRPVTPVGREQRTREPSR
jgi:SAM-dependent methyltransferase